MRNLLKQLPRFALIFSLVFVISGLLVPNQSIAQELTPAQKDIHDKCVADRAVGNHSRGMDCLAYARSNGNLQAGMAASNEITNNFVPGWWDQIECSLSPFDCALRNFVITIVGMMLKLVSLLTGLGGIFLNGVVYYTVVKVAENYANIGAINVAWGVVRDVANMGFIFILLYAAIQTILGIGGDNKKIIVNVIIVAVLINFSLFFTKVVIDISNVLALLFYEAIVGPASLNLSSASDVLTQTGLSNKFTHYLQLQTLYQASGTLTMDTLVTVGVMGSIMLLVAAFVFFSIAIMFVIRYVVLIFVLILSPLAFLGFVFPEVSKYSNQWREALIGQAFFAPVYFLLTWVTLKIIGGVLESTAFGSNPEGTRGSLSSIQMTGESAAVSADAFSMLINFIIIIAFLIISLIISKDWASKAGAGVSGLTKWATGVAGGATIGMAGRFGRGTIGRAGNAIAESEFLKSRAPNSIAARLALTTAKKTGGASFDVRSSVIGNTLDAGKGQKGGFAKDLEEKTKAEKKYADSLKPSDLVISRAERELDNAKKNGTIQDVARAQAEVDRIKGLSEDDARKRKIKELRAEGKSKKEAQRIVSDLEDVRLKRIHALRKEGKSEEEARKQAETEGEKTGGWVPKEIKGEGKERKEAYAKDQESGSTNIGIPGTKASVTIPHFDITGRVLAFGPIKRERHNAAVAIRKSNKEKKPGEKIADEIEKQTKDSSDDTGDTSTPPKEDSTPPDTGTPTT